MTSQTTLALKLPRSGSFVTLVRGCHKMRILVLRPTLRCTVSAFLAPVARPWRRSSVVRASPNANKVFVGRIAWKADVQLLREQMERFGEVRDAHMPLTDGVHRGFGFVTFDSAAAALAAIEEGTVNLLGRGAAISPAKAPDAKNKPTDSQSPRAIRQGLIANLRQARRRQDVERAIEALGSLDNAKEITMAMAAWGRAREPQRALALLEEMQSRGFEPNVIAFNVAISACEKGKQSERALELLDEMQARGVQPDVISFSAAISACEKGGQWERALALLDETPSRGVAPDVIIYSAAISACEACGERETAARLYADAVERELLPQMERGQIDLHGMIAPVALAAVASSLECLARGDMPVPDGGLAIITGKGEHSKDNIAIIKPQMEAMLASSEFAGLGAIEDARNTGQLVVGADDLRAWIDEKSSA